MGKGLYHFKGRNRNFRSHLQIELSLIQEHTIVSFVAHIEHTA